MTKLQPSPAEPNFCKLVTTVDADGSCSCSDCLESCCFLGKSLSYPSKPSDMFLRNNSLRTLFCKSGGSSSPSKQSDFFEDLRVKFVILQKNQFSTVRKDVFWSVGILDGQIANCQSLAFSELDHQTLAGHSADLCGRSRVNANRAIGIAAQRTHCLEGPISVFWGRWDCQ